MERVLDEDNFIIVFEILDGKGLVWVNLIWVWVVGLEVIESE